MHHPAMEREQLRTALQLFAEEYATTASFARRAELATRIHETSLALAAVVRSNSAARLAAHVADPSNSNVPVQYVIDVAALDPRQGFKTYTVSDGPRDNAGRLLTFADLAAAPDPHIYCLRLLRAQAMALTAVHSERRQNLIEAHGRPLARALIREIGLFPDAFQTHIQ